MKQYEKWYAAKWKYVWREQGVKWIGGLRGICTQIKIEHVLCSCLKIINTFWERNQNVQNIVFINNLKLVGLQIF